MAVKCICRISIFNEVARKTSTMGGLKTGDEITTGAEMVTDGEMVTGDTRDGGTTGTTIGTNTKARAKPMAKAKAGVEIGRKIDENADDIIIARIGNVSAPSGIMIETRIDRLLIQRDQKV